MFCGVQGSVLGPMMFLLFTTKPKPLQLIESESLRQHLYVDDAQTYDY